MNPVDNATFTRPLIKALREHVDAFATDMAGESVTHDGLDSARPAAVVWVYLSVLVAWAQDHGLIDEWLRAPGETHRAAKGYNARDWLGGAYVALTAHPATECLLDPRYSEFYEHIPSQTVCADLLAWWAEDAPSLRYDVEDGPASITGWLPGDLLQAMSDARVKAHAFCQTPWWIADGILDLTTVPACGEFRDVEVLRTIDPCCGTGHFLIRQIDYLWEWYTTGEIRMRQAKPGPDYVPVTGGERYEPREAIERIIAGVHGCEKDPLIAAVARLRFVVTIGDLMHRSGLIGELRLDTIPPFTPAIVVGDSLLDGVVSAEEYAA